MNYLEEGLLEQKILQKSRIILLCVEDFDFEVSELRIAFQCLKIEDAVKRGKLSF